MTALPIKGMTVTPGYLAIDNGAAFVSCVLWAATEPKMLDAFKGDTGLDLRAVIHARGIERAIDEATGAQGAVIAKFADWVALHVWGVEGEPEPEGDCAL